MGNSLLFNIQCSSISHHSVKAYSGLISTHTFPGSDGITIPFSREYFQVYQFSIDTSYGSLKNISFTVNAFESSNLSIRLLNNKDEQIIESDFPLIPNHINELILSLTEPIQSSEKISIEFLSDNELSLKSLTLFQ